MEDVTEHFRGSGFKVFAAMLEKDENARVWAIPARAAAAALLATVSTLAQGEGQPGLGYIFWRTTLRRLQGVAKSKERARSIT